MSGDQKSDRRLKNTLKFNRIRPYIYEYMKRLSLISCEACGRPVRLLSIRGLVYEDCESCGKRKLRSVRSTFTIITDERR